MVEQLCKYSKNKTKIKTQWILHLKWVNFMVYKLHFYRAVKKNKNSLLRPLLAYMISSWLYAHQSLNQKTTTTTLTLGFYARNKYLELIMLFQRTPDHRVPLGVEFSYPTCVYYQAEIECILWVGWREAGSGSLESLYTWARIAILDHLSSSLRTERRGGDVMT